MKKLILLVFGLMISQTLLSQSIPYGYHEEAGQYFEVENDTKLYYEIYGNGEPLLMLHGGVYGYIDEFTPLIPKLAEKFKVICLATRGHVKSDVGHEPYTFEQRAADAYKLIQHLGLEQVSVIGFSDGGYAAFKLASLYPSVVKQMVVMGAGDLPVKQDPPYYYQAESLLESNEEYFKNRLSHMPEPKRWDESLSMLNDLYNNSILSKETFSKIQCPVLLLAGEKDKYVSKEDIQHANDYIPDSHYFIITECGHVIFYCDLPRVWEEINRFLMGQS